MWGAFFFEVFGWFFGGFFFHLTLVVFVCILCSKHFFLQKCTVSVREYALFSANPYIFFYVSSFYF